ncbi:hypothetical protein [Azorhizophilus paspali]|uniref:Uncharacterized protein n=1 Tax=Azorhizophilus paspali TaxID=69963 RepID=A0ABV6SPQ8_AZOPA
MSFLPSSLVALVHRGNAPEFLPLPRRHSAANAFGEGLHRAGAPNSSDFPADLPPAADRVPG